MNTTKETRAIPYTPVSGKTNLEHGDTFLYMEDKEPMKPIYTLQKLSDFGLWILVHNETGRHWCGLSSTPIGAFGSSDKNFTPYRKAIENGGVVVEPDVRVIKAINKARDNFSVSDAVEIAAFMNWIYFFGTIDKKAINDTLDELVLHAINQYQNNIKDNKPCRKIYVGTGRIGLTVLFWENTCTARFTFGLESRESFSCGK
jgi:hypothetical protein